MEDSKTFQSWFLVDISPFKMALLNGIKKWSYAFKKHLLDHVIDSLDDLDNFIKGADEGLSRQVVEGDYKGLIKVMEYLAMVKEKQAATDSMFDPLKDVIDLLRNYGVEIPQASMVQLKELPEKWANTKRLSVTAKQQVPIECNLVLQLLLQLQTLFNDVGGAPARHGDRQAEEPDR